MEIKVFNEKDIQTFLTDKKHIVISIQEPNYEFVPLPKQKSRISYIQFHCYDFDEPTGKKEYDEFLFSSSNAKMILNHITQMTKYDLELICINCVVGISRSAGVAGALSKIYNGDDSYFFKKYLPNMLIYRTILEEHNKRGGNNHG